MTGTHPSPHLTAADLAPMQHHADPLADETIAKILGGEKVEKMIDTGVVFVTKDNIDKPEAQNVLY